MRPVMRGNIRPEFWSLLAKSPIWRWLTGGFQHLKSILGSRRPHRGRLYRQALAKETTLSPILQTKASQKVSQYVPCQRTSPGMMLVSAWAFSATYLSSAEPYAARHQRTRQPCLSCPTAFYREADIHWRLDTASRLWTDDQRFASKAMLLAQAHVQA